MLSDEEVEGCRKAFNDFDLDRGGTIDCFELRLVLEAMGQQPS